MKTLPCALCVLCVSILAQDRLSRSGGFIGGTPNTPSMRNAGRVAPVATEMFLDPYRKANGRYWGLGPLFAVYPHTHPSFPGWRYLTGNVAQNTHGGILLNDVYGAGRIFVANYPHSAADGT